MPTSTGLLLLDHPRKRGAAGDELWAFCAVLIKAPNTGSVSPLAGGLNNLPTGFGFSLLLRDACFVGTQGTQLSWELRMSSADLVGTTRKFKSPPNHIRILQSGYLGRFDPGTDTSLVSFALAAIVVGTPRNRTRAVGTSGLSSSQGGQGVCAIAMSTAESTPHGSL